MWTSKLKNSFRYSNGFLKQGNPVHICNWEHSVEKAKQEAPLTEGDLKSIISTCVCYMQQLYVFWFYDQDHRYLFLSPNHSRKFQILRKTAVLTWYWDCDLRTPVPSAKDTHHAVLQVSFLCLWVYYRAALLWKK